METKEKGTSPEPTLAPVSQDGQSKPEDTTTELITAGTSEQDASVEYTSDFKLAFMTIGLCLAVFLVALDESIITTAIPYITDDFSSRKDVGWYGSAYMLTSCAFQFTYGKLYTYYTSKWVFIAAIAFFEVGSLICGLAPTSTVFIIGRAITGVGCSGLISGALVIISQAVPARKRSIYFAGIGAVTGMSSVAAPVMGGAFTSSALSWRWCFYLNLPVGGAAVAITVLSLKSSQSQPTEHRPSWKETLARFDLIGTFFLLPSLICLLLVFQLGGTVHSWSDVRIIVLLVLFAVLAGVFIGIQVQEKENATLPARVVAQRSIVFGALFSMCIDGCFYILDYFLPIWFQAVEGVSPFRSGIQSLPLVIPMVVSNLLAGYLVYKLGYYNPFMIGSTILTAVGTGLMTTFRPNTGPSEWASYPLLAGLGVGMGMQQAVVAVPTVLAAEDLAMGISVIVFFQTLGPAIFISVAQSILQNRLIVELSNSVSGFDMGDDVATGIVNLRNQVPAADLPKVLEACNRAVTQTWYGAATLAAISIIGALGMKWKKIEDEDT